MTASLQGICKRIPYNFAKVIHFCETKFRALTRVYLWGLRFWAHRTKTTGTSTLDEIQMRRVTQNSFGIGKLHHCWFMREQVSLAWTICESNIEVRYGFQQLHVSNSYTIFKWDIMNCHRQLIKNIVVGTDYIYRNNFGGTVSQPTKWKSALRRWNDWQL